MDPYLQDIPFNHRMRLATGFASRIRRGKYSGNRTVRASTVSSALTSVGQTIALVFEHNPFKVLGSDRFHGRISQTLDSWKRTDPAPSKKLPVEADVPEYLVNIGLQHYATILDRAVGDLCTIAFYYLLRVGEYTNKTTRPSTKQTVQFKFEDITFFKKDKHGRLQCLPRSAAASLISTADSATLKLDNQKNGYKGVCINQEANGDPLNCPVRALGRRFLHLRRNGADDSTTLSTYYERSIQHEVLAEHISRALKLAATALNYPSRKGIPIALIDTHSLRSGGANALALWGYSDTQIQKMGRWRGKTFKEYIRESLSVFASGMSKDMKRVFQYVNIEGHAYHDITNSLPPPPQ